jgi:hypothetical protein
MIYTKKLTVEQDGSPHPQTPKEIKKHNDVHVLQRGQQLKLSTSSTIADSGGNKTVVSQWS